MLRDLTVSHICLPCKKLDQVFPVLCSHDGIEVGVCTGVDGVEEDKEDLRSCDINERVAGDSC